MYKKHFKDTDIDSDGVSNIVSSIMMLGVFLTILGMVFTNYVPMWARTGESKHMDSVESSFLDLKSSIDRQITDAEGVGTTLSTSIRLGAEGGTVLSMGSTSGKLEFQTGGFSCTVVNTDDQMDIYGRSYGKIFFESQNVYYTNQHFTFENGALIIKQDDFSVMRAEPDFNIAYNELTNTTTVVLTLVELSGTSDNLAGSDHHTIESTLVESIGDSHRFVWTTEKGFDQGQNITLNITTKFGNVWQTYLESKLENLPPQIKNTTTELTMTEFTDPLTDKTSYNIILNLKYIKILDCKKGIIEINLN